jgi:hypothetical protein
MNGKDAGSEQTASGKEEKWRSQGTAAQTFKFLFCILWLEKLLLTTFSPLIFAPQ